ncbi:uncharacterized protein LOC117344282 [Pecten maximus]|uniref:uncharacterized protein LOC117344282 n=1 Tax=Pecten maximus TaxID=6579 RepID=UPI001458C5D2|nr:uncharacterized protein LOC117344282 [Pecten maximus]
MTEVILPSLNIPGPTSLHPNVSTRKRTTEKVSFPFAPSCAQAFRDRLPPVASRNKSAAKLRLQPGYSPNYWSYGTSYLVTLLFNGRLPNSFLKEVCHSHIKKESEDLTATGQQYTPKHKRKKELWEPKDYKRLQEVARRTEQKVMVARWRQRTRHDSISSKIHETKEREEKILLTKEGMMERGKRAFLNKLKSRAKHTTETKPVCNPPIVDPSACDPSVCDPSVCDPPIKDVSQVSCATEDGFVMVSVEDCVADSVDSLPDDSKSSE